jgi:hypothetical protein
MFPSWKVSLAYAAAGAAAEVLSYVSDGCRPNGRDVQPASSGFALRRRRKSGRVDRSAKKFRQARLLKGSFFPI